LSSNPGDISKIPTIKQEVMKSKDDGRLYFAYYIPIFEKPVSGSFSSGEKKTEYSFEGTGKKESENGISIYPITVEVQSETVERLNNTKETTGFSIGFGRGGAGLSTHYSPPIKGPFCIHYNKIGQSESKGIPVPHASFYKKTKVTGRKSASVLDDGSNYIISCMGDTERQNSKFSENNRFNQGFNNTEMLKNICYSTEEVPKRAGLKLEGLKTEISGIKVGNQTATVSIRELDVDGVQVIEGGNIKDKIDFRWNRNWSAKLEVTITDSDGRVVSNFDMDARRDGDKVSYEAARKDGITIKGEKAAKDVWNYTCELPKGAFDQDGMPKAEFADFFPSADGTAHFFIGKYGYGIPKDGKGTVPVFKSSEQVGETESVPLTDATYVHQNKYKDMTQIVAIGEPGSTVLLPFEELDKKWDSIFVVEKRIGPQQQGSFLSGNQDE